MKAKHDDVATQTVEKGSRIVTRTLIVQYG